MAAVLKKRALAEFSQTVTVDAPSEQPPTKRLRLRPPDQASGSPSDGYIQILQRARSSREALHAIASLSELGSAVCEQVPDVLAMLMELYSRQSDSTVRCCLARLVGQLAANSCSASATIQTAAEQLLVALHSEQSQTALAQCVRAAERLCAVLASEEPQLVVRLVGAARRLVTRPALSHAVHVNCLCLLGSACVPSAGDQLDALVSAVEAQDARVRAAALQALLACQRRGDCSLPGQRLYPLLVVAVGGDDFHAVRETAVLVLHALALEWPEQTLSDAEGFTGQRLIDAAFSHICRALSDPVMRVRVCAARSLGTLHTVSSPFLHQTLDKRLMSNLRRKRTGHERQRRLVRAGQWGDGRRWGDDAPLEALSAEHVSVVEAGACGAFVHGLEDEFMEVRSAALDSLTALASGRPEFARLCVDYVVDMFNDEIDSVRVGAVTNLRRLTAHVQLRHDQLDEVLAVLDACAPDTRHALHRVLGRLRLDDSESLRLCVERLLSSLQRYPTDRLSVWQCCQQLGAAHPALVEVLAPALLQMHPCLQQPEKPLHAPGYTCLLLLVANAAALRPAIGALLSHTLTRHCRYVRDTLPHLVPTRPEHGPASITPPGSSAGLRLVDSCLQRAHGARACGPLQRRLAADLRRLAGVDSRSGGAALLAVDLIEARMYLASLVANHDLDTAAAETVLRQLRHQYSGFSAPLTECVQKLWLRLLCVKLVRQDRQQHQVSTALFQQCIRQAGRVGSQDSLAALVSSLSEDSSALAGSLAGWSEDQFDVQLPAGVLVESGARVERRRAVLLEPVSSSSSSSAGGDTSNPPLCFAAGLVAAISVRAELWHLSVPEAAEGVRGLIQYPDDHRHVVRPPAAHFHADQTGEDGDVLSRLSTSLLISHHTWSEEADVLVSLVLDTGVDGSADRDGEPDTLLPLCPPVAVCVRPRPVRRTASV